MQWKIEDKMQWQWWKKESNMLEIKFVLWIWEEIDKNKEQWKHNDEMLAKENMKKKKNSETKVVILYVLATLHSKKSQH